MAKEDYSWMKPVAPADATSNDSEVAHAHIKRVADEFYRLRAKLSKSEERTETMDYEQMIKKAGDTAEEIIQLRADELPKNLPHFTPEQAYAAVYTAPGNEHLRRAEREANGFVRYTDVEKATVPEARTEPKILQSLAMDEINAIAEQFRA
jgi:hypothetical protein